MQQLHDEQHIIMNCAVERKKIDSLKEVELAGKAQRLVNQSRHDAGTAFVETEDQATQSDGETDIEYDDAIETSSIAEMLEEEFGITSIDGPIDVDAMISGSRAFGDLSMTGNGWGI